ncbi:uncharacterized protein LOC128201080 [Galleria mellonella]|uniref:Uncharacterized protein LOC128201080 n=1 Tax=Galleria mellonella TaxID=7137 RepID=A0ABM3MMQ1_GALME|nr:uncharacterized protein LOC128201080 [Galleria mellonella]
MTTDEEKSKLAKLLQGIDIPDIKLSERCSELVNEIHSKYEKEVEEESMEGLDEAAHVNPYKVDRILLDEIDRKIHELMFENKRLKRNNNSESDTLPTSDPKRPWRTHSSKEKLFRIDSELKRHHEKATELITPLADSDMKDLVMECQKQTFTACAVTADRLRDTVDSAKKNLPNFQYKKINNTTATAILAHAHDVTGSGQYIPRPETRQCFLRSLGELKNLRLLALEYSHIADGTGGALLSLLPVLKRPHFRLQLICREDQTPGRFDPALGCSGYDIPDTAWQRVAIACPDLYLFMAFFRVRDYDNVRRFLSPSIPLREVHLQFGIDLKMERRQNSDISCFIHYISFRYSNTLVTLSIHQWRFVVFPLRRIFELLPRLVRFFYTGKVEDEIDLRRMLQTISCGVCDKLKQVTIHVQDEESKRSYWKMVINSITEDFAAIMQLYEIDFCIVTYKI